MEWFYTKRRGPEWKQGWTSQTLTSMSAPPFHLLTIFAIVIFLLWFSQYTGYKAQFQQTAINFQLFLMVLPLLLILFMASYSSGGLFNLQLRRPEGSPWGVAILLLLILVLLSYQSSFHSKWFGPLSGSD
ncbi:hypothetical protein FEM48_Zijuj09G0175300 [Ziziphus jujuba var. spinosa]|uniref:Uncharacterized protein n=1 Tax=Ziziphus jujuba var. spinosa TaxID=714518 RepID=A0A978UUC4_ZIZJJ|nr:uncharacterized protein LOC125424214 [Ziziphus jujuba var. spinosa]KAH7518474.1 hypothetical protein FEM48_Zijuj09G0175300 [Ziziphus jujuba var. spinosa]